MRRQLRRIIETHVKAGGTLREALLAAGHALLDESKRLVPVNTGTLRDSGYVKEEK
jgi:hypothetical protein